MGCAFLAANPLPVNSLGQDWRNVAPVLKGVKQYLCIALGTQLQRLHEVTALNGPQGRTQGEHKKGTFSGNASMVERG
jgi:hypothetical protein